jgi:hypothetical protein
MNKQKTCFAKLVMMLPLFLFSAAGVVLAWGTWYMNMHEIGHASNPDFAVPFSGMVFLMYTVVVLMLTDGRTQSQKLKGSIFALCLAVLFALGMTGVLSNN